MQRRRDPSLHRAHHKHAALSTAFPETSAALSGHGTQTYPTRDPRAPVPPGRAPRPAPRVPLVLAASESFEYVELLFLGQLE